jgi:uncharacterized protein YcfJ
MKKLKTALLILVLCLSQLAVAGRYTDNAEVVSVKEVYKDHTIKQPYQDCYVQTYRQRVNSDGSATNELFGGLLGGALGHQLGKGSGKKVMTVAGALLGASIANDAERGFKTVNKQVCETKYTRSTDKRFSHYLVGYKYKDKLYSYTTGNKPDTEIRVRVNVVPITSF